MPQIAAAITAVAVKIATAIGTAIAAFGVPAYTAGWIGGMIVKFGSTIALTWATSKLLAPKLDNIGARQADVLELSLGEHPREAIFGRAATGGSLIDAFNWGGSQNDWEAMVIAVADHECQTLVGFYIDGKYVAFTGDGNVSGYSDSNGSALQVFFLPGTMTQTLPATVGAGPNAMSFVSASGGRWTADDRLLGVAAVIVCYRFAPDILGGRPSFRWVVDGLKCYDPRKDSTVAGGSGSHRWDTPSTYEWTENAAVCRYNYLRGVWSHNQLMVGPGRSAEEAPPEDVIAAANICDEDVTLKAGGTVKRYTVSAVVRADEPWIDVEEAFAAAMGAELIERSGVIVIDPGAAKTVAKTFTDDALLQGFPVEVQAKLSRRELVNTVTATYVDPTQAYEEQTSPIRRNLTDITNDGEARDRPLALRFVTSGNQAQRLGEIERRKARLQRTATVTLGPRFSVLEVGDWVTWQGSIYTPGASATEIVSRSGAVIVSRSGADIVSSVDTSGLNRTYMVVRAEVNDAQQITLGLREIASSVYSWTPATDELDTNSAAYIGSDPPSGWLSGQQAIDWSDVTGSGRPADNATVGATIGTDVRRPVGTIPTLNELETSLGTAADFTGRQWGATATEGQASNAQVPLGENILANSHFQFGIEQWQLYYFGSSSQAVLSYTSAGRLRLSSASPNTNWTVASFGPADGSSLRSGRKLFRVIPGQVVAGRYRGTVEGGVNRWAPYARFLNQDQSLENAGSAWLDNIGNVNASSAEGGGRVTVPAGAYWLEVEIYAIDDASTTTGAIEVEAIAVFILPAGHQGIPAIAPGPSQQYRADLTGSNTAADFAGRGGLATANYYRQSTDPGAVAEGSLWTDTSGTSEVVKQRIGGAWVTIANNSVGLTDAERTRSGDDFGTWSSAGTSWTPAGSFDITNIGSGGRLDYALQLNGNGATLSTGIVFNGEWRILSGASVIATSTFTANGASDPIITPAEASGGGISNPSSGTVTYTLEMRRASGANEISDLGWSLFVRRTP
jgi:hypothetical protein